MEGIGFALAKIISERIARHGAGPVDFETIQETIVNQTSITPEQAESLLWGEPVSLSPEESGRLAEEFHLDEDLLSCLLRPTSREILLHVLRSRESDLEPSCEDCSFLLSAFPELDSMSRQEILQMAVDLLEHLSPYREEPLLSPGEENLLDVFRQLDLATQSRVLAYAYSEQAQSVGNSLQILSEQYARLRAEQLSDSSRQILDEIAKTGELSLDDIAARLHLQPSVILECIGEVKGITDNLAIQFPLLINGTDQEPLYSFSQENLQVWRSLVQAESVFLDDNLLES